MKKIFWTLIIGLFGLSGCSSDPQPIEYGKAECSFCKMIIMDKRFGCQVVNTKGKPFHFDDLSCLTGYLDTDIISKTDIAGIYVPDYLGNNELTEAEKLSYVASELFRSPMAGNVAAFTNKDSAKSYASKMNGTIADWERIKNHE
jgi:copper chaperone NosL